MQREEVRELVLTSLTEALNSRSDEPIDFEVTESTPLVGGEAVLESLGLVFLIVEVEQRVQAEHDITITVADDRAMSQRNSPFRTAGTLTDYVFGLIEEQQGNVAA